MWRSGGGGGGDMLVCASLECETVEEMAAAMETAKAEGADVAELRLDSLACPQPSHLRRLLAHRPLPVIASYRLKSAWNWGRGDCMETCVQVLRLAVDLGVEFVEMDLRVAAGVCMGEWLGGNSRSRVIVSGHVNGGNPSKEKFGDLIGRLQATGADIIKLLIDVVYITDLAPLFHMLTHCQVPLVACAVGDRGLIGQLLGPKFGGFLVYGSLGGRSSPGFPSIGSIKRVYNLDYVNADTKVFGLISNPVGHSKGPLLHNPAFRHVGYNGIYVPMLVDNVKEFFRVYTGFDFQGFSVGIPHKEAALGCCDEVHPLAKSIGAVNTIVRRQSDGKLVGYNTDCEACITAIEDALGGSREVVDGDSQAVSPIAGSTFVLVGAGGAGRAFAFGAKSRGARVVVFNRDYGRAKALACAVSGEALPFDCIDGFRAEEGMILANASSVGMQPNSDESPISKEALRAYRVVFDAVYTPRETRLLREAAEVGAATVSGVEMFARQAVGQFRLFTGGIVPEDFMRDLVLAQF